MNTEDLINRKFGRLTVIRFHKIIHKRDKRGKNRDVGYWLCKCACGTEVSIPRANLLDGSTKSCGCLVKEKCREQKLKNWINLEGKKFNKLTVIGLDRTEKKTSKEGANRFTYYWKCKCDCGNEVIVEGSKLREGRIKDCEDIKRNETKSWTTIGNEYRSDNVLKEGTRLDYLSSKTSKANTSGVRGVSFKKDKNKYRARIRFKGKEYHLGYYDTLGEAERARKKAEENFYKPILEQYEYKGRKCREDEEEYE